MKGPRRLGAVMLWMVSIGAVVQAPAQQGFRELPPGKWWKQPVVVRELNLSPDQQSRIESLWAQNRRELIDLKAELDRRHVDLSELLAQPQVDEGAALKAYDQMTATRTAIDRAGFLMRLRVRSILLPEQQHKFEELTARVRRGRAALRTGGDDPERGTAPAGRPAARTQRPRIR